MTKGEFGWALWLAGLPFAPLLHQFGIFTLDLDPWHYQMLWFQAGLIVAAATGLATVQTPLPNRPLAWWIGSLCLLSLWWSTIILTKEKGYAWPLYLSLGHCLTIPLMFRLLTATWTPQTLPNLLRPLAITGALLVAYGVCQLAGLDQFFNNRDTHIGGDVVGGMLLNPNHYGAYLAIIIPLLLIQPERWWKYVAVIAGLLTLNTESVGAGLALAAALAWLVHPLRLRWKVSYCIGMVLVGCFAILFVERLWNFEGRTVAWSAFWQMIQQKPYTGWGPGFIKAWSNTITSGPLFQWRHAHNLFLQCWVEWGLVSTALFGWLLTETFKKAWQLRQHPVGRAFGGSLSAGLVNSLVNFAPSHLIVCTSLLLVIASSCWILTSET